MQQLSNLVQLHSSLQQEIHALLQSNAELHEQNQRTALEVQRICEERDKFIATTSKRPQVAIAQTEIDAEKVALDALEKRVVITGKRVSSLQVRLAAVASEQKQRNKSLASECAIARDRFASSYQAMQVRKRIALERSEEQRAVAMRLKVTLDQVEEERSRVESEINIVRDQTAELESSCKEWMEAIATVVRARRRPKPARAKPGQQPIAEPGVAENPQSSLSVKSFDVVRAYREQQQQQSKRNHPF